MAKEKRSEDQSSIASLIKHFNNSAGPVLKSSVEALSAGNLDAFRAVAIKVRSMEVTKLIAATVGTSESAADDFVAQASLVPGLGKAFGGIVLVAAGGIVLAQAGSAIVAIVGVALMIIGMSILFPSIWDLIAKKFDISKIFDAANAM